VIAAVATRFKQADDVADCVHNAFTLAPSNVMGLSTESLVAPFNNMETTEFVFHSQAACVFPEKLNSNEHATIGGRVAWSVGESKVT